MVLLCRLDKLLATRQELLLRAKSGQRASRWRSKAEQLTVLNVVQGSHPAVAEAAPVSMAYLSPSEADARPYSSVVPDFSAQSRRALESDHLNWVGVTVEDELAQRGADGQADIRRDRTENHHRTESSKENMRGNDILERFQTDETPSESIMVEVENHEIVEGDIIEEDEMTETTEGADEQWNADVLGDWLAISIHRKMHL